MEFLSEFDHRSLLFLFTIPCMATSESEFDKAFLGKNSTRRGRIIPANEVKEAPLILRTHTLRTSEEVARARSKFSPAFNSLWDELEAVDTMAAKPLPYAGFIVENQDAIAGDLRVDNSKQNTGNTPQKVTLTTPHSPTHPAPIGNPLPQGDNGGGDGGNDPPGGPGGPGDGGGGGNGGMNEGEEEDDDEQPGGVYKLTSPWKVDSLLAKAIGNGHYFNHIQWDEEALAAICRPFLERGLTDTVLDLSDIRVCIPSGCILADAKNLAWMIEHGSHFFDAIAFLALNEEDRIQVTVVEDPLPGSVVNFTEVSEALGFAYFFLMTRGNWPSAVGNVVGSDVPSFLKNILGLKHSPSTYATRLASFSLTKLPKKWIKFIPPMQLPEKVSNRLAMGLAGLRVIAPFKNNPITRKVPEEVRNAVDLILTFLGRGAVWEFVSATRDPRVLTSVGTPNKEVANLLLAAYSQQELVAMAASKQIFEVPVPQAGHHNWKTWNKKTFSWMKDKVFYKVDEEKQLNPDTF